MLEITPEMIGYIAASLTTASFLPQAIMTLKTRDTEGLSLGMYSLFTSGVFLWLVYGVIIKNNVIIFANSVTLFLASIILAFKLIHTIQKIRNK